MYVADHINQRIRKVTVSTGIITTIAGSSTSGSYSGDGGDATSATLSGPLAVALDASGTGYSLFLYFWFYYYYYYYYYRQRVHR